MKRITTALGDIALAVVALSLSAATTAADKACDQDLDIIPAVAGAANVTTVLGLFEAAGLLGVLESPGPLMVIAPTDQAVGDLLVETGGSVEDLIADPEFAKRILKLHLLIDNAPCTGGLEGRHHTALTDGYLTFENGTITDENGSVANVVGTAPAGNGWVYVVDRVLLPEADEK